MSASRLRFAVAAVLLCQSGVGAAQALSYAFDRPAGVAKSELRLRRANDGADLQLAFAGGQALSLDSRAVTAGDGVYYWTLVHTPQVSAALQREAESLRASGGQGLPAGWPAPLPVQSGLLVLRNGQFVAPELEPESDGLSGEGKARPKDQVINDDLIVLFSACVGFDCTDGEAFGSDTLRLKENNLRMHFQDTSNSASFPSTDWRLEANDSTNGGESYFRIIDADTGRGIFHVEAGAPINALRLEADGDVAIGNDNPADTLHMTDGNTPAVRLEQNGSQGFSAQTWRVAGNEANFFIEDTTGGARLPFRIRPGAPTSSVHIETDGDVGLRIAAPEAALHLRRPADYTESLLLVDIPDDMDPTTEERRLELDNSGNLFVGGTITQLSSRHSKENFLPVAGLDLLARLRGLELWTWNYRGAPDADRHLGPVAEDFHAAFGFGTSERSLAPADVAGVALAASQALAEQIEQRDAEIAELKARLARLEQALERLTAEQH